MLNAPPYLAVVGLAAVVAGLAGVEQLCREVTHRRGGPRRNAVRVAALVAHAALRPAARAVLAVTVILLLTMVAIGAVQLKGAAGAVAQPVAFGVAAGLVLMTLPRHSAAVAALNGCSLGSEGGAGSPTSHQTLELSPSDHEDFARWEAELRIDPHHRGTGETVQPPQ